MRERPILFSAPMVRAIQDDRKTQTRRVVNPQPVFDGCWWQYENARRSYIACGAKEFADSLPLFAWCPYGAPGDRLWVRESGWQPPDVTPAMAREGADTWPAWIYSADDPDREWLRQHGWISRPSIHMPRWASRITLEVTGVRVEQLQEITDCAIRSEGVECPSHDCPGGMCIGPRCGELRQAWRDLWDGINAKRGHSWASNPWVWVVEFRRVAAGNDGE